MTTAATTTAVTVAKSLLRSYADVGYATDSEVLSLAGCYGPVALAEAAASLQETGRENSTAMVVVSGDPPGKNICGFIRSLITDRSKLIVVAQPGMLASGDFERLIRISMPDCEKKLRIMDSGLSLADAVSSAERNRHYRPSQALEVFCNQQDGRNFAQEIRDGNLKFDPTVIRIRSQDIPKDDVTDIVKAVQSDDQAAMHRVLDPHIFSSQDSITDYQQVLAISESVIKEFLSDIAPSRELAIRKLHDIIADTMGDEADDLEYLGTGRNGSAYRHPDGFVVKVTTDELEVRSATRLEGLKPGHLGRIFAVRPVGNGIWMLIQEDLEKLPPEYSAEFDIAMEVLDLVGATEALNSGDCDAVVDALSRHSDTMLTALAADVLRRFNVLDMCYELGELGLTGDFHSGNVMLRLGSPVLVDLGTPGDDPGRINEFGTGAPASGANGPPQMRGSNSSSWSSGRLALKRPDNHVPEDENATERDTALDWGPGRVSGASF